MCMKGKKTAPAAAGNFRCAKCGAVVTKKDKGHLCKAEKIKAEKKGKKGK